LLNIATEKECGSTCNRLIKDVFSTKDYQIQLHLAKTFVIVKIFELLNLDSDEVFSLDDLDYLDKDSAETLNKKLGQLIVKLQTSITKPPIDLNISLEKVVLTNFSSFYFFLG
jgi:hypothetical protein